MNSFWSESDFWWTSFLSGGLPHKTTHFVHLVTAQSSANQDLGLSLSKHKYLSCQGLTCRFLEIMSLKSVMLFLVSACFAHKVCNVFIAFCT